MIDLQLEKKSISFKSKAKEKKKCKGKFKTRIQPCCLSPSWTGRNDLPEILLLIKCSCAGLLLMP